MSTAVVVLAQGFEQVEAVTSIDILRRAGIRVHVAGVNDTRVEASRGIQIIADVLLEELDHVVTEPDCVVLPGGMPGAQNLGESDTVKKLVDSVHKRGGLVAAICAAPVMALFPFGLLENRLFTHFPAYEGQVTCGTYTSDAVVRDGNLITSRGPGTAAQFALSIVEVLEGSEKAEQVGRETLFVT